MVNKGRWFLTYCAQYMCLSYNKCVSSWYDHKYYEFGPIVIRSHNHTPLDLLLIFSFTHALNAQILLIKTHIEICLSSFRVPFSESSPRVSSVHHAILAAALLLPDMKPLIVVNNI